MARPIRLTFHGSLLALTLALLGLMALTPARQLYDLQRRIGAEQRRLAVLTAERARLEERLRSLQDPDYVEKLARDRLGLVRPGETSYLLVPGEASTAAPPAPPPPPAPWYLRAWRWALRLAGAG